MHEPAQGRAAPAQRLGGAAAGRDRSQRAAARWRPGRGVCDAGCHGGARRLFRTCGDWKNCGRNGTHRRRCQGSPSHWLVAGLSDALSSVQLACHVAFQQVALHDDNMGPGALFKYISYLERLP